MISLRFSLSFSQSHRITTLRKIVRMYSADKTLLAIIYHSREKFQGNIERSESCRDKRTANKL